jgi:hypothetical protein
VRRTFTYAAMATAPAVAITATLLAAFTWRQGE